MLIEFKVKNYRSIYDEATLSLLAGTGTEFKEVNTFKEKEMEFLKSVLIFGANSSGKSNLIEALNLMKKIVEQGIMSPKNGLSVYEPFLFISNSKDMPSEFEISFINDRFIYEYGFHVHNNKIVREYLYKKDKRRTILFERLSPSYEDIKIASSFKFPNAFIVNTREDVLFLSLAEALNIDIAIKIVACFNNLVFSNNTGNIPYSFYDGDRIKDYALSLMKRADKNIDEIHLLEDSDKKKKPFFTHKLYSKDLSIKGESLVALDSYASSGTKHLHRILKGIMFTLENGGVFIMDEIDKHLHPLLIRSIIGLFNSIEHNPKNSQLICTAHDVLLLDEDIRRDQIWFIEKNKYGMSSLYSLDEFKNVRKNSDILKKYLLGVYGAIPNFG